MTTGRPASVRVGVSVHDWLMVPDAARRRDLLSRVADAGLDHVAVGDHVSFHGGTGFDGLVSATAALAAHDTLGVLVGVYQLALRHPLPTARQLASIAQLAPGRLTLGVGVAGEDRLEVSNCGVDPATRGRRTDEAMALLRELATGRPVDHDGRFFTLEQAAVLPAPTPRVPLVVGGAGDAAVRRTARYGDGWLGMFCSARRFGDTREQVVAAARDEGRTVDWFGLSVWCGLDPDPATARSRLGDHLEALYHLPPERFARLTPAGTPAEVADFLTPYVAAGATDLTLIVADDDPAAAIRAAGEVRTLLQRV